jgi:AraC-like DNA-binding protein
MHALAGDGGEALAELPRESTVSVRVVRSMLDTLEQMGVSRQTFLSGASVDLVQIARPEARISRLQLYGLVERALEITGDPAFGLHWGERISDGPLAPVSYLMAHAPSLRRGLEVMQRFEPLFADHAGCEVLSERDGMVLRVRPLPREPPRVERVIAEVTVAGFFRSLQRFCRHARPMKVCFAYAAPSYHLEYAQVFGAPVFFSQEFSGLVFDDALLDLPAIYGDAGVYDALHAVAEESLLVLTRHVSYQHRLHEFLVRTGWKTQSDMERAARALGLSVRTLRRRLHAEGTTYAEVLGGALAAVAMGLLRDERRTIQETAYAMGFSDASTFHRAFRRWTGTTPNSYRKAQSTQIQVP